MVQHRFEDEGDAELQAVVHLVRLDEVVKGRVYAGAGKGDTGGSHNRTQLVVREVGGPLVNDHVANHFQGVASHVGESAVLSGVGHSGDQLKPQVSPVVPVSAVANIDLDPGVQHQQQIQPRNAELRALPLSGTPDELTDTPCRPLRGQAPPQSRRVHQQVQGPEREQCRVILCETGRLFQARPGDSHGFPAPSGAPLDKSQKSVPSADIDDR
mmetsp:Transcript_34405/g.67695  ORF Transcript_34405/g.67695 Transcript_34405/m.67695 type:complete len:213 (+) Transcript_34405:601-1239(+)